MNKFFSNIINIILGISCILWFYGLAFIFFAESLYRITLEIEIHSDEKGVKQFTEFDSVILEDEIADRLRGRQFAFDTLKKLSPRYGAKYSQEDSNEILEKIFNRLEYVPERFPKKNKEKSFPTLIYYSYLNINTSEPEFSKRIFNIFGDLLSNEMKNINESMRMITLKNIDYKLKIVRPQDELKPFYPNRNQSFNALFITALFIFPTVIIRYKKSKKE